MLNPKHILQLHQAIELILGPHPNQHPSQINTHIQKGQSLLHTLRTSTSYPYLLAHFLTEGTSNCQNMFNMDRRDTQLARGYKSANGCQPKMFVLLELSKVACLDNQAIWWHLLYYFYACPQKLQSVIIEMITKHLCMTQLQQRLCNTYRPFITYLTASTLTMTNLSKTLRLTYRIITKLCTLPHTYQYPNRWKIQHIQYIVENLLHILTILRQQYSYGMYVQVIVVYIMRLVMLGHQLVGGLYDSGERQYRYNTIQAIKCNYNNLIQNNPIIMSLLVLASDTLQISQHTNTFPTILYTLDTLLRTSFARHNNHHIQAHKIIVYFLLKLQHNREHLHKSSNRVLKIYYEYIVSVQANRTSTDILYDSVTDDEGEEQHTVSTSISYYNRYIILQECIKQNYNELIQNITKRSQISTIVYLSYSIHTEPTPQILQTLRIYLQSTIDHPISTSTSSSSCKPIILCCLRYLYRFALDDNFDQLVPIFTCLLDLRATYPQYQHIVDMILCKGIGGVIGCYQENQLWDFATIWVCNLCHNYMDVNAISFYPLLLIFQSVSDYRFLSYSTNKIKSQYQIDFPAFFEQLLQLLIEQSQDHQPNLLKGKNKFVQQPVWCDRFQIFYKLCAIVVRYIITWKKYNGKFDPIGCHNCDKNIKIYNIIDRSLAHMFKNQLYSTDTAYLYMHLLIYKNDVNGIVQFMGNMMTQAFWSGYDQNQIVFYACVFVGLYQHYRGVGVFECQSMLTNLMNILDKIFNSEAFPEQSQAKIRNQISQFRNLIECNKEYPQTIHDISYQKHENMKDN